MKLTHGPLAAPDRIILQDGRRLEGCALLKGDTGIVLALSSPAGDLRLLVIDAKRISRHEAVKTGEDSKTSGPGPAPRPGDAQPPASKPQAGPDTVILKDGAAIQGRIVLRSEEFLVEIQEGKRVRVETEKMAEIRSESRAP